MTVSSGVVYAPAEVGSNRFIVAWAHGTIGLALNCAPSRQVTDSAISPWLNSMLERGWVVTAPDYAGAGGTGGPAVTERYLIGAEQGRDLLNSVRAARNIPQAGAGTRFALYGHSQGGAVALWAAQLSPTYTPELTLVGVGAVSAASDIGSTLHEIWNSPLVGWLLGPSLVSPWTRYYPNLDAKAILTPAGLNHYQEMAATNCISDLPPLLINPLMGDFLSRDPTTVPAWRTALLANQAPLLPKGVPAFIGHGLTDPLIYPGISAALLTRYCESGTTVAADWLPGVGHADSAIQAAPTYIQWLAGIIGGEPARSDCGKPMPVTPIPPLTA
jgi:pimeloyl-ACP methyl ester carboxylesterase